MTRPGTRFRSADFRLRGDAAFANLFQHGRRFSGRHLQLIAMPAAQSPGRLGFVIGRHALSRAVDRNRLRRRLREAVRAARPQIERYDIVLRIGKRLPRDELEVAAEEGADLLHRLLEST